MLSHSLMKRIVGHVALCGAITGTVMFPIASVTSSLVAQGARAGAPPTLIIVSVDGMRPDYVSAADAHGIKVPALRELARIGAAATGVRGVVPTVTYPSHTTIVTGVNPAKHGILSNAPFDPFKKNAGGWYWYAEDIRVPTLWDIAASAGRSTAAIQWPVTVGAKHITWNIPEIWHAGDAPDDYKLTRAVTTPGLIEETASLGEYPGGAAATFEADSLRGVYAEWILEHKHPSVLLLHVNALDHVEHETGPFTPEVIAGLERLDGVIGRFRKTAERVTGGNMVFAVVSDHGFMPYDAQLNLFVAFKNAGLITVDSHNAVTDWAAMPWSTAQGFAIVLKRSDDSATAARVRTVLTTLQADSAAGIDRVVDAATLKTHDALPGVAFYVPLKSGWRSGSGFEGPVYSKVTPGGAHGGWFEHPELYATFIVTGVHVPAGKSLGVIDLRDIGPTLAALVGLPMPNVDGKNVLR